MLTTGTVVVGPLATHAIAIGDMSMSATGLDRRMALDQCRDPDHLGVAINGRQHDVDRCGNAKWRAALDLIEDHVPFARKQVSPKEVVYTCGKELESLYVICNGSFKIECISNDGRALSADILLDGDWLGFDAISSEHHTCSATALDFGEVWVVNYQALLRVSAAMPALLAHLVSAISKSLERSRDQMLSNCSLLADRRVADFLLRWTINLSEHGRRTDMITVPLKRAEIGSLLAMRIETVSRALSHLANLRLITFDTKFRRQFSIPSLENLSTYVRDQDQRQLVPELSNVWPRH
jgi:CRP/FNR family transcriptional regulator